MASQDSTNMVENIVNTQKQVLDTIVENTKKFTAATPVVAETMEKGSEWYKNWLESQKNMFTKTTEQATTATETVKETAKEQVTKMNDFFENWFKMQVDGAKKIWEIATNAGTTNTPNNNPFAAFTNFGNMQNPFMSNNANPFASWQGMMNNMNNMHQWGNWMSNMQQMNPLMNESFKKATEPAVELTNAYYEMLHNNFNEWQKNMQGGTILDAYKSMINTGQGFTKFTELWEPMFKSIQDKTFNMDMYKQMMNPEMYKEMMDKYLGFMPESSRNQFKEMGTMMNEGMKHFTDAGMRSYHQMRGMMNPNAMNHSTLFGDMLNTYNNWHTKMNETAAPFTKMATPNQFTKGMATWSDLTNRITVYNIKNAELQYMIYSQGQKVMDALAENTAAKVKEGKEITSMLALYQEWLAISDKVFVSLFESDAYSQLMSEVGSMQMGLRKDIDMQLEKSMENLPVAKRSELDELYRTIHDLKAHVRTLEKSMEAHLQSVAPVVAAATEVTEEKPASKTKKA